MRCDWQHFSVKLRELPNCKNLNDQELQSMLLRATPPPENTDEIGTPLPGSSLISEHPDLPNYKRIEAIRYKIALDDGDTLGAAYSSRVLAFLRSHPDDSPLFFVNLSTQLECYQTLYFPSSDSLLFSRVRYLEGRNRPS